MSSKGEKDRLAQITDSLCMLYVSLSTETAKTKRWKLIPKPHLLFHLGCHQARSWENPRFAWTYADEDEVGALIKVASPCHTETMAETALYKNIRFMLEADA